MAEIFKSLHGRQFGLSRLGALILNRGDRFQEVLGLSSFATITSAQLLALNATAQLVTPALVSRPGETTKAKIFSKAVIHKPAGTAYAGIAAGEDLVFKYTNAAGQQVSGAIETTGFLDQATAQTRAVFPIGSTGATAADITPVALAGICLHLLTGEITTGNSPLYVRTWYDIVDTVFTS